MAVVMNLLRSRLFRRTAAVLLLAVAVLACLETRKPCGAGAAPCVAKAGDITGSVPARAPLAQRSRAAWSAATAVTVRRGDTVDAIARRHGVPAAAILQANQLPDTGAIWAGQRLVVPLS